MKKVIFSSKVPSPIGPYSQGLMIGGTLYLSGQIALDVSTNKIVKGSIKDETRMVMEHLKSLLEEAGLSLNHVVKATIFLKNMNDFVQVNEVYSSYFTHEFPARATVEVSRLPKDANIEISMIAQKF